MIQLLATRYNKQIAYISALIFYVSMVLPAYGMRGITSNPEFSYRSFKSFRTPSYDFSPYGVAERSNYTAEKKTFTYAANKGNIDAERKPTDFSPEKSFIDGPSQPEMSSFKSVGSNDMVNLFTGDFSYNIPLLDVGGYPVNIFYDGNIGMEQEASWVGLGWNINPGNVNRNTRGIPDDFSGEEKLVQIQNMKRNKTWGISIGGDFELVGIKLPLDVTLGYSLNNYLGPAIELGLKGSTSFSIGGKSGSEKGPIGASLGLSADLNSRSGMTLTPNVSLSANAHEENTNISMGVGASTSYNSRTGIKSLQLNTQLSFSPDKKSKDDYPHSFGGTLYSTSISFVKPSYIPSLRPVITNSSGAGRFQIGGAMFGAYGSLEADGYAQVSEIEPANQTTEKPMVGYLYAEKAKKNRDAVMDFTRFNDNEVTPTTTIISVPQYAYDVFSIQGEGTGGSIRLYRNDNGYVRDNYTPSKDKSWSAGVDIGIPGHVGANFNLVKTPSAIKEWGDGNKLRNVTGFGVALDDRENVYFRNPGENSVLQPHQYDSIGGLDLVRYKLGGTKSDPTIEPKLQKVTPAGNVTEEVDIQRSIGVPGRKKRTQVTSFLTAEEANEIGLDKKIKSYNPDPQNFLYTDINNPNDGLKLKVLEEIDRFSVNGDRKKNHISQINVTEADGKRYIYGLPVYNLVQKDFSFTVGNDCSDCDLVPFTADEPTLGSPHLGSGVGGKDGFVQTTITPPYAHSFLLTGLLSPDYVDVNGDGITEDDLGTAVKFNYTKVGIHKWRTPLKKSQTGELQANSNPGNLSEKRDDKGIVSYGERESWFLHSIESKTMIAFFVLDDVARLDGKGVDAEFGDVSSSDNTTRRLKQIDLYNKADLKKNGLSGPNPARPVKTVHFQYDYALCNGTPDNQSGGKLTLEKIWFTYNGQNRTNKNQYVFSYGTGTSNPSYAFNASDRWGNYKPVSDNPQIMKNRDYSYSVQDKTKADQNANAWNLKKILLPSGGQLEVTYESDDYAYVQDKKAAVMSEIIGFGSSAGAIPSNKLYTVNGGSITENDYIFIKVPEACTSKTDVLEKYLKGMDQLAVKMLVNMPKGQEYITSYALIEDYNKYDGVGGPGIWIRMKKVEDKGKFYSPLSVTALEFIREKLPAQAFKAYDVTEGTALEQLETMFKGLMEGISTTFSRIPQYLRELLKAQTIQLNKSFARLDVVSGYKYGGGNRVRKIVLKDNWDRMTGQFGSVYGQEYDYTKMEVVNKVQRTISSGVASYEPAIGGEENPFHSIVQLQNKVPLGPTSYGAIEMPVMDAFFPAPSVGYSKVTVTSIGKKQNPDPANKKTRSGVGRQVTEFYTARDFPVYYTNTPLDGGSDWEKHIKPSLFFFYKYAYDSRTISQGFLVATNDMHGKMKSQTSFAENDPAQVVNYTENFYRNTGTKGLDEKFSFIDNSLGGEVVDGNMGIDVELMTDTRQFTVKTASLDIHAQVDWMLPPPFPLWLPFIWPVTAESENTYRAVTTTKVINYHAVVDSVIVIDKGSQVSTKNLVYDAETGQVIVNRTHNEFEKHIYSVSYPAYWAYSGMGLAYKNIDAIYRGVKFEDGKITDGISPADIKKVFESGDELYIMDDGDASECDPSLASPAGHIVIWAFDKNKNGSNSALTDINPDFIFIDQNGKPYYRNGVTFRIVRSGRRNMLGTPVAAVSLMTNPIDPVTHKFIYTPSSRVLNGSAVEYKEKWQTDNEVFYKYRTELNTTTCEVTEVPDCAGYLEKGINPYRRGLLGNFVSHLSRVYYSDRIETNPSGNTNLSQYGFLSQFTPFWIFNSDKNLVPDNSAANMKKWVANNETMRFNSKGMQLETKDALGIFTAAQYGYKKALPTAIANNSYYGEMFYDGFEDYDYNDLLNTSRYNSCAKKYIDLSGIGNTQITDIGQAGFNAHTGKYMLKVNPATEEAPSVLTLPVSTSIPGHDFSLAMQPTTISTTVGAEPNAARIDNCGDVSEPNFHSTGFNYNFFLGNGYCVADVPLTYYIKAPSYGTYNFASFITESGGGYTLTISAIDMQTSNETVVHTSQRAYSDQGGYNYVYDYANVYLCADKFYVVRLVYTVNPSYVFYGWPNGYTAYWCGIDTDPSLAIYRRLESVSGSCNYTKPIPASESMMNPSFAVSTNKKMVFSGWVRDNCTANGGSACENSNQVDIEFVNSSSATATLIPSGPVIEGWQRYEGYFTAPAGTTEVKIHLKNNSEQPVYFDDIRVHPFNSNMKSYVYDPVNLRLTAELDANNYAAFYEYDEEGTLIRTKAETRQGIKTITESRSAKQKNITDFQ